MFFSLAYLAADSSIILLTKSFMGATTSPVVDPLLTVPLLDEDISAALVVRTGDLEGLHKPFGAYLFDPLLR